MTEHESAYYNRRAAEEHLAAQGATCPAAMDAHLSLALGYALLAARSIGESPMPSGSEPQAIRQQA
jgi:hypothetical protein